VSEAAVDRTIVRGPLGLWLALLAGPLAGSVQLSINYALVKWACANGGEWAIIVIAVVLMAIALGGAALGAVHLFGVRGAHPVAQTWSAESRHLLAAIAIGLNVLIAIFFVNTLIAYAALTPCE
jgi:hypothetical protein